MEEGKRWSVTYTKHIKQKRKLYLDGFLHLQISTNKVALYDEFEKLLVCRILKTEETVSSGDTLEFNGYLVDIGDPQGQPHNKPHSEPKLPTKHNTASRIFRTPTAAGTKVNENVNAPQTRKPLSPSQHIIREFKKREQLKYGSPKISPETTNPSSTEWQVLYTTHVTQKAKKYHDGFLRLVIHGSRGGQVMLFDESMKLLDSRFLRKDDVIKPGESISFDAYLIDIGECQRNKKPDCSVKGENLTNVDSKEKVDRQHISLDNETNLAVGKRECQVLYTAQLTQKAKKYHDGFLELEFCGSRGRQVALYDLSKRLLERRFLKKDEIVKSGESLKFDGHLVEVGELEGSHESPKNEQETDSNTSVQRRILRHGQNGLFKVNPSVSKGQPPSKACIGQDASMNCHFAGKEDRKSEMLVSPVKALRDANQILSILQDPIPVHQESSVIGGQSHQGSCLNAVDCGSTGTVKSLHSIFCKAARSDVDVDVGFHLTGSAKIMPQQPADIGLFISTSTDHSACAIINESEIPDDETFPSFDLGF
ncbi:hypothetical protein PIB30_029373 [Stylosanthes scabra]|uniref:5'-3' DNA helicase ZGRF1-like N-terminal domain-containing protein n=1 Tax=Stylosanthes scabra TaxID=79078 RepID=A0ABU6TD47_9FABA|nr:hypothetical protein [Stylosanthes scabra]